MSKVEKAAQQSVPKIEKVCWITMLLICSTNSKLFFARSTKVCIHIFGGGVCVC